MTKTTTLAMATAMIFTGTFAMSQAVTGGDVSIAYAGLTDTDLDTSGFTLSTSAEIALARDFAVQGDFSYTDGEVAGFSGDILSLGAHAIYHANAQASFGAYYGQDSSDGEDLTFYGVEGGYEQDQLQFSGYFGLSAVDSGPVGITGLGDIDLNQFGLAVSYDINPIVALNGRYDQIRFTDAAKVSRLAAGVATDVGYNVNLAAEIGRIEGDLLGTSGDETYASATATYTFGAERGATFAAKGLTQTIFGF